MARGGRKMSIYDWKGDKASWKIREIEYVIKCYRQGSRTDKETLQRIKDIIKNEARKD